MKKFMRKTDIRLGRYFSTVLSSFRYSLETHPSGSDSPGCKRFILPRTVPENYRMSLIPAFLTYGVQEYIPGVSTFYDDRYLCVAERR